MVTSVWCMFIFKSFVSDGQETMWRALAAVALTQKQLKIAHKCHQVLGNKARTLYLEKTMKIAQAYAEKIGKLFRIFH
jgi:hypothetical protein